MEIARLREIIEIAKAPPLPLPVGNSKIPKKDKSGRKAAITANELKFP